ncbi:hypothetical protein [Thalassoglobus sp.]|uniref:hypothetical protein n=1 Tax=Thalassoglobus sp. TaxID=2795869 RepID=UPI003AA8B93D
MWRLFLVTFLCFGSLQSAEAIEQKFPYQATVIAEKVEVRCGPGANFYVTGHVQQKETVTVHRHDHGGWFMIAPPKGSLSWIDAELVKRTGGDTGVVQVAPQNGRPARAIVRIGSELSKEHSYYGRELSNGDEVTILGEETLTTQRGPVRMLKIVPPAQEFRWMKGEFLVPLDKQIQQQIAHDPYQVPTENRSTFLNQKKEIETAKKKEIDQAVARRKVLYDELDRIDRVYASMMQKEPAQWDLESIEDQYQLLAKGADSSIGALIQKRMDVLKRRREILSHYQEFVRVSAASARRDKELVAQQLGFQNESTLNQTFVQGGLAPEQMASQPGPPTDAPVTPRLNGAGIIRPLPGNYPGTPRFALVAPDGRMLAYLEAAEGVRIDQWLGKPAGIIGSRGHHAQLGADVIRVQRVVPVQLVR